MNSSVQVNKKNIKILYQLIFFNFNEAADERIQGCFIYHAALMACTQWLRHKGRRRAATWDCSAQKRKKLDVMKLNN